MGRLSAESAHSLSEAPLVESELARLVLTLPDQEVRSTPTGIFRQAIVLHRASGVEGYLGAPRKTPQSFSIILKRLFLCAAYHGRNLWLMVENHPGFSERGTWRDYDLHPSAATKYEMAWVHCSLDEQRLLKRILADDEVWRSYERMLQRITAYKRSDRPDTVGRLSVLT